MYIHKTNQKKKYVYMYIVMTMFPRQRDASEVPSLRVQIVGNGIIQGGSNPGLYMRWGP